MKRYRKEKRATYKAHTRKICVNDAMCDGYNRTQRIHIHIKYDTYDATKYTRPVIRPARINKTMPFVEIPNAIHDIFPEISTHKRHIYKGTAPYKNHIIKEPDIPHTAPEGMMEKYTYTFKNIDRVKCIIYSNDKMIHYGIFTRIKQKDKDGFHIYLERNKRQIEVHPYVPYEDDIHGVPIKELYARNIEIYHI